MWCEIELSNSEVMYFLSDIVDYPEVFDDLLIEEVSDDRIEQVAYDGCNLESPSASIDYIDSTIQKLADNFKYSKNGISETDLEEFNNLESKDYYFTYTFYLNGEPFSYDNDLTVHLSAEQARGLVLSLSNKNIDTKNWVPCTISDLEKNISISNEEPKVSHEFYDAVYSNLEELADTINEYMSGEIDEAEVRERLYLD